MTLPPNGNFLSFLFYCILQDIFNSSHKATFYLFSASKKIASQKRQFTSLTPIYNCKNIIIYKDQITFPSCDHVYHLKFMLTWTESRINPFHYGLLVIIIKLPLTRIIFKSTIVFRLYAIWAGGGFDFMHLRSPVNCEKRNEAVVSCFWSDYWKAARHRCVGL